MKSSFSLSLCFFFALLLLQRVLCENRASSPPRGWNSYDSFSWIISEEDFLNNAELVAERLKAHGYEYVVVDYLWYRRKVKGAYSDSLGFDVIDEWGRMIPDPDRWPSSKGGKGFSTLAKKVHSLGLKFGIHVMRGISTQAVNANTPILDTTKEAGRHWHAKDVGVKERACAWMSHGFMSVNTKVGAGRAFLRSLYQQYADWGVDFVKHDCVFGDDLDLDEISIVSEVLKGLNRSILYSLSPGTSVTPEMAKDVKGLVNMYRITGDDWDSWEDVSAHFAVTRDFSTADMIGAQGLLGKSWPDLDMLPIGFLTDPGSNEGPHRTSKLSLDEQRTQFPYVTSTNGLRFKNRGLTWQSRSLLDTVPPESDTFGLTSCMDPKAKGWFIKIADNDIEQVCWKGSTRNRYKAPFCLYKRKSRLASDEDMMYKQQYQGNVHLLATDAMEVCLDASPTRKLASKEIKRGSFSPCKWDTNQMWELSNDGTLKNNYSGLCASMKKVKVNAGFEGIRSWIATGRKGEIYVAFFNLSPEKTVISAKISDLAKVLPDKNLSNASCFCKEVWSGEDLGEAKESISTAVETHGSALFVLDCS
ncbi:hypothetical protein RHGRI_034282 [Rhododendron griersonianum]|uniref:alpha-galactosidase n=1 Tax=Rhododendron griersonianum TaxID=479676 RepID=A0AAV6I5R8_9ERIC|nr:hypothetical protein RHGRI_034282 [Rhododendron griersonianum]KAG5522015.1 hypothetical protein RHGRI_034282 [Rhododendron griersonianum]